MPRTKASPIRTLQMAASSPSTRPSALLALPNELLHLIAEDLYNKEGSDDLGALRITCKQLCDICTPVLWHDYVMPVDEVEQEHELLSFQRNAAGIARHVRHLKLGSIDLCRSEEPGGHLFGLVFTLLAASSLSNLTSLSLFVDVGSRSRWLPEEVEDMLKNLKCLRTLKLGACGWYTDDFKVRRAVPSLREIELEQWEHEGDTMDMSILSISPEDQATAARLTKLVLNRFEADNDELFSCLVEPCLESLLVLKLGGVLKRRGLPSNALPYAYLHSLRDNVLHVAVNRSLYLPLERLEISLWKVFEVAADGDKFEAESVDEQQDPANAVPPAPKYTLPLFLEFLAQHAPRLHHLKLEDCGSITSFPPGNVLCPWPVVHGIRTLELVASASSFSSATLSERTSPSFRNFFNRLPSLTHLYLTGYLENHSPASLASTDMYFAIAHPSFFVFLSFCAVDFPNIQRIEWRWNSLWRRTALLCSREEGAMGSFSRELYSEY